MNTARWKRRFVLPFFTVLGIIFAHSTWRLFAGGLSPVWAGPAITAGSFFFFLGWVVTTGTPRTSERLPGLLGTGAGGVAITIAAAIAGTTPSALPLAYAVTAFAGLVVYVFWYSELDRQPSVVLSVGRTLPEFQIDSEFGVPISSHALRGQPAVWLFFRGNWCPLCMAQIQEVADLYKQLAARGAQVALVSPQSHEQTRALARRFGVPFRYFVDPAGRAARALGIFHESGVPLGIPGYGNDTVFPTVIVTDAEGRILLADQTDNYRVRPDPTTFLAALDAANPDATSPRVRSAREQAQEMNG
jgi:peroxiredoxin